MLKKTIIGEQRNCGLILKPFDDAWTFTPYWGRWLVIPLNSCTYSEGGFLIDAEATQSQWYITNTATNIVGKALILLVNYADYIESAFSVGIDKITFDRDDLYTKKDGLVLYYDADVDDIETQLRRNLIIASFYHIQVNFVGYDESVTSTFKIWSDYKWDVSGSSGVKSGQFIL